MNHKRVLKKVHRKICQEATEWFVAFCEGEVDASGTESFDHWLRTSPEHVRAYLRISSLWESAGLLAEGKGIDVEALTQRARSKGDMVALSVDRTGSGISRHESAAVRRLTASTAWQAIAACLLLVSAIAGGLLWWHSTPVLVYQSGAAERRTVRLPDGSSVQLNVRSRITLHFTTGERAVDLVEGQALFSVVKDPRRAFIVHSDATRVTAVGTRFDVYRKISGTIVTVLEGKVAIRIDGHPEDSAPRQVSAVTEAASPALASAGEQAIASFGAPTSVHRVNVFAATAWTEGKLMFDSAPLRQVLAEFNRIGVRRLVIEDDSLLSLHITGIFPAADLSQLVAFLRQRFGLSVRETHEEVRLSSAPRK
jgi:transmembrane sensor